MKDMEFAEAFREEAVEILDELDSSLLELEKSPKDLKLVARVFRAMHTVKGSAAMFGFDGIADFTHKVETTLDKVRSGTVPVTPQLIGLVLASKDYIRKQLDAALGEGVDEPAVGKTIIVSLAKLTEPPFALGERQGAGKEAVVPTPVTAKPPLPSALTLTRFEKIGNKIDDEAASEEHFCIYFRPFPQFFEDGGRVAQLLSELQSLGEMTVFASREALPANGAFPDGQAPFWDILLTTRRGINAIKDVFIFTEHCSQLSIVVLEEDEDLPEHRRLGQILIERGDISAEMLQDFLKQQKLLGELLVESKAVLPEQVEAALAQQRIVEEKRETIRTCRSTESIRVAADKLDALINLVGELVVAQAQLRKAAQEVTETKLLEPMEEIERLTTSLRDCALNIGMLPVGSIFSRFKRMVRDLAWELGKEIELEIVGAEIELDKRVLDQLADPLVHLIRNSIDHGIESSKERRAVGKPARGTIRLVAEHIDAKVVISVADDGRGLDAEGIRSRAVENGLLSPGKEVSPQELFKCIFVPGFSTASEISKISGRGVGMDVVKNTIEGNLQGSVELESRKGEGTVVSVSLPHSFSSIQGLLVRVSKMPFVLPRSQVEACVALAAGHFRRIHGRKLFCFRDRLIPYIRLTDFFELPNQAPEIQQMAIVQVKGERFGLIFDEVAGEYQKVLKFPGRVYRNATGISGAAILNNGEVAQIVDVAVLLKYALEEEQNRQPGSRSQTIERMAPAVSPNKE